MCSSSIVAAVAVAIVLHSNSRSGSNGSSSGGNYCDFVMTQQKPIIERKNKEACEKPGRVGVR